MLVEQVAQEILHDRRVPRWGHVVARISFAGTLLEKPPPGRRLGLKECESDVSRDCQSLVALLCDWLSTRLARGTRRLGERGQGTREGLAGRAPRTRPCDGHPATEWPQSRGHIRFSSAGRLSVNSSFLLFWRSQAGRNRPF